MAEALCLHHGSGKMHKAKYVHSLALSTPPPLHVTLLILHVTFYTSDKAQHLRKPNHRSLPPCLTLHYLQN